MDWFKEALLRHGVNKNSHGEAGLTTADIRENLTSLHEKFPNLQALTEDEIQELVHYMDPNLDGHVTRNEMKQAFRRAKMPPNSLHAEYQCGIAMGKLEQYMKDKKIRMSDLFNEMDKDGSGYLNLKEFGAGLEKLVGLDIDAKDAELGEKLLATHDELVGRHVPGGEDGEGEEGGARGNRMHRAASSIN
jgi:Ca2+-binding EF-hand superfamily protein